MAEPGWSPSSCLGDLSSRKSQEKGTLEPAGQMGDSIEEDFSLWLYMKRESKRAEEK